MNVASGSADADLTESDLERERAIDMLRLRTHHASTPRRRQRMLGELEALIAERSPAAVVRFKRHA